LALPDTSRAKHRRTIPFFLIRSEHALNEWQSPTRRTAVKQNNQIPSHGESDSKVAGRPDFSVQVALKFLVGTPLFVALVNGLPRLNAQSVTSGDTTGTVTDPSGAVVGYATVTLRSGTKGNTQVQTTDSRGAYRFSLLEPGS